MDEWNDAIVWALEVKDRAERGELNDEETWKIFEGMERG